MIEVKLFGIPNCNTVKKAKQWLEENEIAYQFHDFKKLGVSDSQINKWFDVFGWEKVLNKSGLTFKKLSTEEKQGINNTASARLYLQKNTSAIKRPIIEVDENPVLLGFIEEDYQKHFKK